MPVRPDCEFDDEARSWNVRRRIEDGARGTLVAGCCSLQSAVAGLGGFSAKWSGRLAIAACKEEETVRYAELQSWGPFPSSRLVAQGALACNLCS